jgi:hypothetical protein
VDFILERKGTVFAVEIKATKKVTTGDLRGLKSFATFYGKRHTPVVIYMGEHAARLDGVDVLPLDRALDMLAS